MTPDAKVATYQRMSMGAGATSSVTRMNVSVVADAIVPRTVEAGGRLLSLLVSKNRIDWAGLIALIGTVKVPLALLTAVPGLDARQDRGPGRGREGAPDDTRGDERRQAPAEARRAESHAVPPRDAS